MPLNTLALGFSLTPTAVSTLFSHYLHRKSLHHKPTVHISYDEGITIVREFIKFSSKRPIEYIQEFTGQRVPAPHWVKLHRLTIPAEFLLSAATALISELGPDGVARVGGKEWWQWRGPSEELRGEWIEMRDDYNKRKRAGPDDPCQKRIMLYIHGAEYRLAPQFPFPCGLQDSLAAYLFLLRDYAPNEIIFAGDSAGGGMILSMLVICRDQGIPLPAGAILISPWVDLTHSFPSVAKVNPGDYIPPHGFIHKPSAGWPPPNDDEIREIRQHATRPESRELIPPEHNRLTVPNPADLAPKLAKKARPPPSVVKDGKTIEVKDQIHMYTTNDLLFHPLVSPVFQPSLGGLPPLQVLSGGGEMLRDEQFYIAHKAANPTAYAPSDEVLDEFDPKRLTLHKYPGTYVQLQVWDDLCHVAPMLSFTRPAKYMFRAIAQFGAWALGCAQDSEIEILNDDEISPISSSDSDSPSPSINADKDKEEEGTPLSSIGRAGDPLPAFKDRMIRQRVGKKGHIYPLEHASSYSVLRIKGSAVGAINPELLMRWMLKKEEWDHKFEKEKARVQQQRIKDLADGFQDFHGDIAPPSSLAARRFAPGFQPHNKSKKSYPMMFWSNLASKHDKKTIEREHQKADRSRRTSVEAGRAGASMKETENEIDTVGPPSLAVENQPNGTASTATGAVPAAINVEKATDNTVSDGNPSGIVPVLSPLIVLPHYEASKANDENVSTRALFHASGIIPSNSDQQRSILQRPSSHGGSATIQSGFTSDLPDDTSSIGDDKSLAMTSTGVDAASTRAIFHSPGVAGLLNGDSSAHHSVDSFLSAPSPSEVNRPESQK